MMATLEVIGRDPPRPSICSTSGDPMSRRRSLSRRVPGGGRSHSWKYRPLLVPPRWITQRMVSWSGAESVIASPPRAPQKLRCRAVRRRRRRAARVVVQGTDPAPLSGVAGGGRRLAPQPRRGTGRDRHGSQALAARPAHAPDADLLAFRHHDTAVLAEGV